MHGVLAAVVGRDSEAVLPWLRPLVHWPAVARFLEAVWRDGFFRGAVLTSLGFLTLWLFCLSLLLMHRDHRCDE